MSRRKVPIRQPEIVQRFAARLRELRQARGMTQADLARHAGATPNYVGRLEAAGAAPGIDLVERLAVALGTTPADLLTAATAPDTHAVLQQQARYLLDRLVQDREALVYLVPLMARLAGGGTAPVA